MAEADLSPEGLTPVPQPDPNPFIPWLGGENPAGNALVDVRFRNGDEVGPLRAWRWIWSHHYNNGGDIIAWRYHKPEAPTEGGM